MYHFLAHRKLLSRMIAVGLFDDYFASIEKYTAGNANERLYLQDCVKPYDIDLSFPHKNNFSKDTNFSLFFKGIRDYMNLYSIHVMFTLLKEDKGLIHYSLKAFEIEDYLDSVSDEHLKHTSENLDYFELDSIEFFGFRQIVTNDSFEDYLYKTKNSIKRLNTDDCDPNFHFLSFSETAFFNTSDEALKDKFSNLMLNVNSLLQQKTKSHANTASHAHKKRVKKHTANSKQPSSANFAYRVSPDMPLSYFQPSKTADFGFNLIKSIDLFGLHLILVAQRREAIFKASLSDNFRGNYHAIENIDLNRLISLRDIAINACHEYKTTCSAVVNQPELHSKCLRSYIDRNSALLEYAYFYNNMFHSLVKYTYQVNLKPWFFSDKFFDNNWVYVELLEFCKSIFSTDALFLFTANPNKAICLIHNSDNKLLDLFNNCATVTMYEACSKFASTFDNLESTHPLVADFKDIAQKVINYRQELKISCPKFPFPVKLDNYTYEPHDSDIDASKYAQALRDTYLRQGGQKFNLASKVLELNYQPNDYVLIFSCMSFVLDAINDIYISLFAIKTSNKRISCIFNWYGDNSKDVEVIFPLYKKWSKHPIIAKLADTHKRCFEMLVLILDLKGELHELYEDDYFSELLKNTGSFDEEFALSLSNNDGIGEDKLDQKQPVELSKQEKVLLNKAAISFIKIVNEFSQTFYDLANNNYLIEIDEIWSQLTEKHRTYFNSCFSNIKNILHAINCFTNSLIISLDNVPLELKPNFVDHGQDYENSEINVLLYQSIKEAFYIIYSLALNNCAPAFASYWNYQDVESFKKYYSLTCPFLRNFFMFDRNSFSIFGMNRMLALNPNLDEKELAKVKQSYICEHVFVELVITRIDHFLKLLLTCIECCLVNYVARLTTKKSVVANLNEINILFSICKFLHKLAPLKSHGLSLFSQANMEHIFLTENDEFRGIIRQYLNIFKTIAKVVVSPDYDDFKLDELNHQNLLVRYVYFLEQLLSDPATVLTYLNYEELNNEIMTNVIGYASSAPFYGPAVFRFPPCCNVILQETACMNNTVPVFLTLFGKEFTESFYPIFIFRPDIGHLDYDDFYPNPRSLPRIQCKPVVIRALDKMLEELSYESIELALDSIDIYQGVDTSVDNWSKQEYTENLNDSMRISYENVFVEEASDDDLVLDFENCIKILSELDNNSAFDEDLVRSLIVSAKRLNLL